MKHLERVLNNTLLLTSVILAISIVFFSEAIAQQTSSKEPIETVKMGTRKKQPTVQEQRDNIERHLKNIEIKENYIKSDDSLKFKAEKSGWFKEMEAIRKSLLLELEELDENAQK